MSFCLKLNLFGLVKTLLQPTIAVCETFWLPQQAVVLGFCPPLPFELALCVLRLPRENSGGPGPRE